MKTMNETKKSLGQRWIKSDSGTTWICPLGALDGIDNPTDDQLAKLCVNESENPHND